MGDKNRAGSLIGYIFLGFTYWEEREINNDK
jgi:hypothetical protein